MNLWVHLVWREKKRERQGEKMEEGGCGLLSESARAESAEWQTKCQLTERTLWL